MPDAGTTYTIASRVYSVIKKRVQSAVSDMIEGQVRDEVGRQLAGIDRGRIEVDVRNIQVIVAEVLAIAAHDGLYLARDASGNTLLHSPGAAPGGTDAPVLEGQALPAPPRERRHLPSVADLEAVKAALLTDAQDEPSDRESQT